jgi:hypothetical protein
LRACELASSFSSELLCIRVSFRASFWRTAVLCRFSLPIRRVSNVPWAHVCDRRGSSYSIHGAKTADDRRTPTCENINPRSGNRFPAEY